MSENGSPKPPRKRDGAKILNSPVPGSTDRLAAGYDFLLVNSEITEVTFPEVMQCVSACKRNRKVVLVLVTYGGDANAAYRIGRYLQTVYEEDIIAFTPAECKSAGTLLVTAANSIAISPFGEIGPLDVQLLQRDELAGRRSGLTTRAALENLKAHSFELFEHIMIEIKRRSLSVSFRLAAEIASKMSSDLLGRVYEQIIPAELGQDNRDLSIAYAYGERLNERFGNLRPAGLKRLVYEYPSHDFVIDLREAKQIFERAELPSPTLVNLMDTRTSDCLIPKGGRNRVIEMLTTDGQTIDPTQNKAESSDQNATSGETTHAQTSGSRGIGDGKEAAP